MSGFRAWLGRAPAHLSTFLVGLPLLFVIVVGTIGFFGAPIAFGAFLVALAANLFFDIAQAWTIAGALALLVVAPGAWYLARTRNFADDGTDYETRFDFIVDGGIRVSVVLVSLVIATALCLALAPGGFLVSIEMSEAGEWANIFAAGVLVLDCFLKVIFFDFVEIFEFGLRGVAPVDTFGRGFVFVTRAALSVAIGATLFELFSADMARRPLWTAKTAPGGDRGVA